MFRLDCMPSSDDFCRFISWDHYGERFYAENMPERHRYEANWHPSPPEISDEQLEAYKRLEATITGKGDISPLAMSIVSRTRIRLLEALVVVQVPDTVEPNIFCDYPAKVSEEHSLAVWLRKNLCVFTWTHLYDESNLKAAIVAITTCLRPQSPRLELLPLRHC